MRCWDAAMKKACGPCWGRTLEEGRDAGPGGAGAASCDEMSRARVCGGGRTGLGRRC